jgi:hypothetical protein
MKIDTTTKNAASIRLIISNFTQGIQLKLGANNKQRTKFFNENFTACKWSKLEPQKFNLN